MGPLALAGISLASGVASGIANRALNRPPEVPDLSADVVQQYDRLARRIDEAIRRREERLEGDLAARGVTGSGGVSERQALYRSANDARLRAAEAASEATRQAQRREDLMRYQQEIGRYRNRAQAISDVFGTGPQLLALEMLDRRYGVGENAERALDAGEQGTLVNRPAGIFPA